MSDWAKRLDGFLQLAGRDILRNAGKVSADAARAFALSEFEQYRITQDILYRNDFDRLVAEAAERRDNY